MVALVRGLEKSWAT